MNLDIKHYAKTGFAHFMLYPDCVRDETISEITLGDFSQRDDIECLDCCLPYNPQVRQKLIQQLSTCDKHIGYAIHPFPLDKISLGSLDDHEQGLIRLALEDQLRAAGAIGAKTFTIASGLDPGPEHREAAKSQFRECCRWICDHAKKLGMIVTLEPFDRNTARNFLYGPTHECIELIESLKPEVDNLKIQLDIAHIRLSGETFEHAIRTAQEHLQHMHLGNCVMKDQTDPYFGDRHPPIGYHAGEIDTLELIEVLKVLIDVGYLSKQNRGTLVIEARPLPGVSVEQTIQNQYQYLDQAWALA